MMRLTRFHRLDARDRYLYRRWVLASPAPRAERRMWKAITHVGGLTACTLAVLIPLVAGSPALRRTAIQAAAVLVLSNLTVQLVKRRVLRERPALRVRAPVHLPAPDAFSFPSGHSAAAMAVAFAYASAFPALAGPLLALATLVGFSRVRLGVHFPGDVLAGQVIALAVGVLLPPIWVP